MHSEMHREPQHHYFTPTSKAYLIKTRTTHDILLSEMGLLPRWGWNLTFLIDLNPISGHTTTVHDCLDLCLQNQVDPLRLLLHYPG